VVSIVKAVDSFLRIKAFVEILPRISELAVGGSWEFIPINFHRLPQTAANASAFTIQVSLHFFFLCSKMLSNSLKLASSNEPSECQALSFDWGLVLLTAGNRTG